MSARVLIVVNSAKFFLSHRLPVAEGARAAGHEVHVATPDAPEAETIRRAGFPFHAVPVHRGGVAPVGEARTILGLVSLYRGLHPALVHHVTLKPVLYGTLAARIAGVPAVVNAVTGLGYMFAEGTLRARAMRSAFLAVGRVALHHRAVRFIFQNPEDQAELVQTGLVSQDRTVLIRGSGVDTAQYQAMPEPPGTPLVILSARMLWQKGVREFVEAARLLRGRGLQARFALVGEVDPGNPESVPQQQMDAWASEGVVECWGHRGDMPAVLASATVVALPSIYREGVPKALIEAASCGRAIVTTDMPGCREIVRHETNGLLVPPRNPTALADALARLLANPEERARFGRSGRDLVEREFAVEGVVRRTLGVYAEVLGAQ